MKITFTNLDKDEVTILTHARDFHSALFKISELARREIRKDETTKAGILSRIISEIPSIMEEIE